jgi:transcriptional regulator GlxA family with amidase domain
MTIAILLFDNFTALDVVGPYEVLAKMRDSRIYLVGTEKREYPDSHGLKITADYSIDEVSQADILLIPGGFGIDAILKNREILEWVRKIDSQSKWTVSVCAGSLLLAEAGLLNGRKCTSHWGRKKQLSAYQVVVSDHYERYVQDGKYLSSAGVSAGIDMALFLVGLIAGEQTAQLIQLAMEYDPKPPYDMGTPDKAPKELLEKLKR